MQTGKAVVDETDGASIRLQTLWVINLTASGHKRLALLRS